MKELSEKDLLLFLNNILARAEAVLEESQQRKLHEPTVEFYRGQKVMAEQLLYKMGVNITDNPELIFCEEEKTIKAEIDKGKLRLYNEDGTRFDPVLGGDGTFIL